MDINNPINRQDIIGILKSKDKMEKVKATVTPTVISDTIIRQYVIRYNKDNKIYDKDDEPLWKLEHLTIEYKNVLQISNLAGMEGLIKL